MRDGKVRVWKNDKNDNINECKKENDSDWEDILMTETNKDGIDITTLKRVKKKEEVNHEESKEYSENESAS